MVGQLNPDSRRLFQPLQHGEGGEGVFQTADLVDELFPMEQEALADFFTALKAKESHIFGLNV